MKREKARKPIYVQRKYCEISEKGMIIFIIRMITEWQAVEDQ